MTMGLPEAMLVMLTLLLLPAMGALVYGVCSGAFERDEDVKYMALADEPPRTAGDSRGERLPRLGVVGRRGS